MAEREDLYGMTSPGGFVFGVSGWHWADPKPKAITFFLDNTAKVSDQYGRPIAGAELNNRKVLFAQGPPSNDDTPNARAHLGTHAQVIAALEAERVDWHKLPYAGFPQLPYAELKKIANLPPTPIEELRKIKDNALRKDALRIRREIDEAFAAEMQAVQDE